MSMATVKSKIVRPTTLVLNGVGGHDTEMQPKHEPRSSRYKLTVEIPCFTLYFCSAVTGTAMANIMLSRTCELALGYSAEMCQLLNEPGEKSPEVQAIETEVQRYSTTISTVKSIMDGLIPAMLALFLGPWSNKYGRKPLIMWPMFGYAFSVALMMIYIHIGTLGPWWFIVTSLPYSFAGGGSAFTTGAFCLLNDLTTDKDRTLRLAVMQSSLFGGLIVGLLSSSFLYGVIGTSNLLIMGLCVASCGFAFSFFFIKESVVKASKGGGLRAVFDFSLVTDMMRTCFKHRPSYGRLVLVLLILPNCIDLFVNHGSSQIEYLFVRQRLNWTLAEQNLFSAVNTFIMIFGLFFGVLLLQRLFKLTDVMTTMISYVSCSLEAIVKAFVRASWMMYFGSAISVFRGLSFPLVRSMITKRVQQDDVAKIFALMSAIDAMLPLVAPLTYNTLYRQTLDTVPGAVFFMTTGLYLICFVVMWAARCVMMRHPLEKNSVVSESVTATNL